MTITASEKLLSLKPYHLEVFKVDSRFCVMYQGADVLDGVFRKGEFGSGSTFEEACEDYLGRISGKKLVFGFGDNRKEVTVLGGKL